MLQNVPQMAKQHYGLFLKQSGNTTCKSALPDGRMAIELEAGSFTLPLVVLLPKALLALCLEQPLERVQVDLPQRRQHLQI